MLVLHGALLQSHPETAETCCVTAGESSKCLCVCGIIRSAGKEDCSRRRINGMSYTENQTVLVTASKNVWERSFQEKSQLGLWLRCIGVNGLFLITGLFWIIAFVQCACIGNGTNVSWLHEHHFGIQGQ